MVALVSAYAQSEMIPIKNQTMESNQLLTLVDIALQGANCKKS